MIVQSILSLQTISHNLQPRPHHATGMHRCASAALAALADFAASVEDAHDGEEDRAADAHCRISRARAKLPQTRAQSVSGHEDAWRFGGSEAPAPDGSQARPPAAFVALACIRPFVFDIDVPPSDKETHIAPLEDTEPREVPALVQLAKLRQRLLDADQPQGPILIAEAMPAGANADSRAQTHDHLLVARRCLHRSQHGPIKQCWKLRSV